ncbi:phosphoglycerate mutase-like protein [Clathrospora elynae]|uniref:Phosphoglycerate mutase-like protein n=1 Tax=Clathrospora elynae TaxID=706981 RepID=A0A6A5SXQ2_9PLEO|nr:phosphoglycerate mutase-like protein [Clathrospora elynae]
MFTRAAVAAVGFSWLVTAQSSQDDDSYHPHAAFAFIRTGERTPLLRDSPQKLTALGANQMHELGQNFRSRYIAGDSPGLLGVEHIAGMSPDVLDNNQILVQTLELPHLVSSAQAFMQGLYPPHGMANGTGDATGLLANGTIMDYPLNGYQYANIQAASQDEPNSRFVSGTQNCPMGNRDAWMYLVNEKFQETKDANKDFYKSLNVDWFEGNLAENDLQYKYALEIADYLSYQYAHNSSIHSTLANDSAYAGTYDKIRQLADEEAWYFYGNTSTYSTDTDNQAIGGKTLAGAITNTFSLFVADKNNSGDKTDLSYPLTLYFGEQDAMISLLSLMMLDMKDENFRSIPPYGSAIVFELFSTGDNVDFPTDPQDLWVRFSFHNGTAYENKQLVAFPILGNGPSNTDMQWPVFLDMFSPIAMTSLPEWCETCDSPSLFCWGIEERNDTFVLPVTGGSEKKKVAPVVAGVIGAVVTLAVAGLFFAAAMLIGGIRFHRVQHNSQSALGGFKGSAKLASDPDLGLAKKGATPAGIVGFGDGKKGHERVDSWELRQKEFGRDGGDESRRSSFDAIDAVASRPVESHEHV